MPSPNLLNSSTLWLVLRRRRQHQAGTGPAVPGGAAPAGEDPQCGATGAQPGWKGACRQGVREWVGGGAAAAAWGDPQYRCAAWVEGGLARQESVGSPTATHPRSLPPLASGLPAVTPTPVAAFDLSFIFIGSLVPKARPPTSDDVVRCSHSLDHTLSFLPFTFPSFSFPCVAQDDSKLYKNTEIANLIVALGLGLKGEDDLGGLRYGKVGAQPVAVAAVRHGCLCC